MGWIYLLIAGVVEVFMTTAMRYSEGFTKLWPTAATIGLATISFLLVARASETVPLGTAYAAWGAFGVIGTALLGIFYYGEPATFWRLFFLSTLLMSVVVSRWSRTIDRPLQRSPIVPMTNFSPREIVSELDRYIIGQADAKRAVAIALRNRWRRQQLSGPLKDEVLPKEHPDDRPTGVGKTEISRRLAKLAGAPFLKVEATKFTEVGYVGRDVDSIVRDLVEVGITLVREAKRVNVRAQAEKNAEERVLDALVGATASPATRESFRKRLRNNELNDKESRSTLPTRAAPRCRCSRFPHARRFHGRDQPRRSSGQSHGRAHEAAPRHREGQL